jgi:flagella basal body P-ring formation protein FlgA
MGWMKVIFKFAIGFGIGFALSTFGFAGEKVEMKVEDALKNELVKKFVGAKIDFLSGSTFPAGRDDLSLKQVRILSETGTGTADYTALYTDGTSALGQVRFSAMIPTYVASKRVHPGERLSKGDFQVQSINIAQGLAYTYRGVMLGVGEKLEGLQARQTILEGQYPLSSGVERIPDIRRGDPVELKIMAGDIALSTMGLVQEPGYLNQNIRVLTQKTKKELIGKLKTGGIVEVRL